MPDHSGEAITLRGCTCVSPKVIRASACSSARSASGTPGALLELPESLQRQAAVRHAREREDRLAPVDVARARAVGAAAADCAVARAQLLDLGERLPADRPWPAVPSSSTSGPSASPLLERRRRSRARRRRASASSCRGSARTRRPSSRAPCRTAGRARPACRAGAAPRRGPRGRRDAFAASCVNASAIA